MKIYCLDRFKLEFDKLKSKKSYRSIEQDIISYFFGKTTSELASGTRLNNSVDPLYIKKRINGSGGFRFYFLLIIKNDALYLMFVHPKTGSMGASNITDESKAALYKQVLADIQENNLFELSLDKAKSKISFTPT